jgi:hypothetical protein
VVLSYLAPTKALYRLRRWRFRVTHSNCPLCGDTLAGQITDLLGQGFYRAAITASRLRLELVAIEYYRQHIRHAGGDDVSRAKLSFKWVLDQLEELGEIDHLQRHRLRRLYARSSRVVHGAQCSRGVARQIVRETAEALGSLKGGGA